MDEVEAKRSELQARITSDKLAMASMEVVRKMRLVEKGVQAGEELQEAETQTDAFELESSPLPDSSPRSSCSERSPLGKTDPFEPSLLPPRDSSQRSPRSPRKSMTKGKAPHSSSIAFSMEAPGGPGPLPGGPLTGGHLSPRGSTTPGGTPAEAHNDATQPAAPRGQPSADGNHSRRRPRTKPDRRQGHGSPGPGPASSWKGGGRTDGLGRQGPSSPRSGGHRNPPAGQGPPGPGSGPDLPGGPGLAPSPSHDAPASELVAPLLAPGGPGPGLGHEPDVGRSLAASPAGDLLVREHAAPLQAHKRPVPEPLQDRSLAAPPVSGAPVREVAAPLQARRRPGPEPDAGRKLAASPASESDDARMRELIAPLIPAGVAARLFGALSPTHDGSEAAWSSPPSRPGSARQASTTTALPSATHSWTVSAPTRTAPELGSVVPGRGPSRLQRLRGGTPQGAQSDGREGSDAQENSDDQDDP
ncbi:unnamed protein product [Prorocentrum cordatum]|uniref:Uncharacterized protein n=1 Tax=Prorocentrum cordatum TaxID=2364126 RepID=A0ABN9U6W9_9DINO|nr:unnamed protein product [Polarella glacialis]